MGKRATAPGGPGWSDTLGRAGARRVALECLVADVGVLVRGVAGIGKSRFLDALATELGAAGRRVVHVRATSSSQQVPLGVFSALLSDVPAAAQPAELVHALRKALARQAAEAPLVVVVDDVHLLDDSSATLLHQVARSRVAPVMLSYRDGEVLPGGVEALRQDGIVADLRLGALSPDEARTLVQCTSPALSDRDVADICRAAEGVPLFLVSGARDAAEAEADGRAPGERSGLVEVVNGRLGRLADHEREALELVALSEPLELGLAEVLAGSATLVALERRALLKVDVDDKRSAVRLAHPLYSEGLLRALPTLRRRALLRSLAQARREYAPVRRPHDLLRLVLWQLDGGDAVDVEALVAAASAAAGFGGAGVALRLARLAWERHPDDLTGCLLAVALLAAGEPVEVDRHCEQLAVPADAAHRTNLAVTWSIAVWAGMGDTTRAMAIIDRFRVGAGPAERAELDTVEVMIRFYTGHVAAAVEVVDRLLADADLSPRARVQALFPGVLALAAAGRTDEALQLGAEARAAAPRFAAEVPMAATQAACVWGYASMLHGEAEACATDMTDEVRRARLRFDAVSAEILAVTQGLGLRQQGLLVAAADAFAQLQPSPDLFSLSWLPFAHAWRAACLARIGRVDDAVTLLQPNPMGGPDAMHVAERDVARAEVQAATGDPVGAARLLDDTADRAAGHGQLGVALAASFRALSLAPDAARAHATCALAARHDGRRSALMAAAAGAAAAEDAEGVAAVAARAEAEGLGLVALDAWDLAVALTARVGSAAAAARVLQRAEACRQHLRLGTGPIASPAALTDREWQVAERAAAGLADREIAADLGISVRTVHAHLRSVYTKLGVDGRADLRHHPLIVARGFEPARRGVDGDDRGER